MTPARRIPIVPNVAIIGGTLSCVIRNAFPAPQAVPTARAAATASHILSPPSIIFAITAAENARTEATERSMPAVRITMVIPAPMIPTIAMSRAVVRRLVDEPKFGLASQSAYTISARKISAGSSLSSARRFAF